MKQTNSVRFTLVELLVVIVVIAVLAGMLLPALNMAKNKAQEIDCIARKKELMQCIRLYMMDYSDYVPGPRIEAANTGVIYPVLLNGGYLGGLGVLEKTSHCTMTVHTAQCSPHNNNLPGPSAGVNANFRLFEKTDDVRRPYKMTDVLRPSDTAYLADTRGWADSGCEDGKVGFSWKSNAEHIGFFHGAAQVIKSGDKIIQVTGKGRAAVSYCDGHAGTITRDQLLQYGENSTFYNPSAR